MSIIMWGASLVQTALVANRHRCHPKSILFMRRPHLIHQRILMLDKQIEHAVDYFSQDQTKVAKVVARIKSFPNSICIKLPNVETIIERIQKKTNSF